MTFSIRPLKGKLSNKLSLFPKCYPEPSGLAWSVRFGIGSIILMVLGFGSLIAFLPMNGAVISPGEITVETHVKEISHPFGGVANNILVKDGDIVRKGQPLIRLDSKVSGAAVEFAEFSLDQLLAKATRLRAIQTGSDHLAFPMEMKKRSEKNSRIAMAINDENQNFRLHLSVKNNHIQQLKLRVSQSISEIRSFSGQINAFNRQSFLIHEELKQTRELYANNLTTLDRLNALERSAAGIEAQKVSAIAGRTEVQARIAELRTQISMIDENSKSEAALELVKVENDISELRKESTIANDQNDRAIIRAPQDGIIDKLQVHTTGSVVRAGDVLMAIVPLRDRLVVKAHIRPLDIDKISRGQVALLRFTTLNARTTPEIYGVITQVAADRVTDPTSNTTFYPAMISIPNNELKKINHINMVIGMPVETFIQTDRRTILRYIIRPISDQIKRALVE